MHWLLILSLLSSTTDLKDQNASGSSLNRLAESALRQKLGSSVRNVRVDMKRGQGRGNDFDYFNVSLDGFSADRLLELDQRTRNSKTTSRRDDSAEYDWLQNSRRLGAQPFDLGDIFGGDFGGIFDGGLGDILGGAFSTQARIGKMQINAADFSYDSVRYNNLSAGLGEIKFNWPKALQGEFDVQSVQPGNLGVQLRSDQAQKLIAPRLPSVRDVKLRFDNGLAYLGGRADVYGVNIPFEAGGKLSVQTNQVRADDLRLAVSKLRIPSFVMNEITKSVNPLYDFDPQQKWPLAVNLNTASAHNEVLAMRGGLQWLGFKRDEKNKNSSKNKNNKNNDAVDGTWRLPR